MLPAMDGFDHGVVDLDGIRDVPVPTRRSQCFQVEALTRLIPRWDLILGCQGLYPSTRRFVPSHRTGWPASTERFAIWQIRVAGKVTLTGA